MAVPQSTVFISYRRKVGWPFARIVCDYLREHNHNVFLDTENLDGGRFEPKIFAEIANRQDFLVILTHGTLEGCQQPDDWVRREIEHAMISKCNIVPILVDDFDFDDNIRVYLPGRLAELPKYNGPRLRNDLVKHSLEHLRTCFLTKAALAKITAPPQRNPVVQDKTEQTGPRPFLTYPYGTGKAADVFLSSSAIGHVGAVDTMLFSKDKVPSLTPDFQKEISSDNPYHIVLCDTKKPFPVGRQECPES